ncbi:Glycosyltransferase involved in cell wall bisynthesis [Granulicella rosea]|uniref:Glycosyltransferase involved in cell wall bisynthesis n=1 Tax=Granulicella rosea TaxID=474952 RepID=A0A239D7W7_9BACT|nr:glycosyltransferase [Granulicella rosea]SNS28475.1 Glycosyltransferase involved in cell wall bisynthesis [Granulicella rosea]
MPAPRVAYFPDSFHEVNGVAHTSRNFVGYAERHGLPMLCVRAGERADAVLQQGSVTTLELARSRAAVGVEKDLSFDPLFWRHKAAIERELDRFQPDMIHMTGPSELGIFAAYCAWDRRIPLAASWHTNVHEYAARRLEWMTKRLPANFGRALSSGIENRSLDAMMRFYSLAKVLFAPNDELCRMLERRAHRPCCLMQRGVDTTLFDPAKRTRPLDARPYVLGYVGRLSIEKNVGLLPSIQRELTAAGHDVRFLIVGHGSEEESLRRELPTAEFTGVLRGEALARAYADMDVLVFPSHTDTFGNVVLEALASGVPAIVTPDGGPKYIVREGSTGFAVPDAGFAGATGAILQDPERLAHMRAAAREYALGCSWDAVFDRVYEAYSPMHPLADWPRV